MYTPMNKKPLLLLLLVANFLEIVLFVIYRGLDNPYRHPYHVLPPCPTPQSERDSLHEVPGNEDGPSLEHEVSWRRARQTSRQGWIQIRYALNQMRERVNKSVALNQTLPNLTASIDALLESAADYHRTLRSDLLALAEADGREEWKSREAKRLGQLAQKILHDNQNPKDCARAKLLVFQLPFEGCGFGCLVHYIVYSLTLALKLQRTLVVKSTGVPGLPGGWSDLFRPLSETCPDVEANTTSHPWGTLEEIRGARVVNLPMWGFIKREHKPPHTPFAIPASLASHLTLIHGDPSVWWLGQVTTYVMRPSREVDKVIAERKQRLGFQHPIVGVHVRRTDKVSEAKFYNLSEYMSHVKEHYDWLESGGHVTKRRVFLATDELAVLSEMNSSYPGYEFIYDARIVEKASPQSRRDDPKSALKGIVVDISLLSQCDLIVCTMSSNVCRLAYELMQSLHTDAADLFRSVDSDYFFYFEQRTLLAIANHAPPLNDSGRHVGAADVTNRYRTGDWRQIALTKGDKLTYQKQNLGDGWLIATNTRTRQSGLVPAHKVEYEVPVMEIDK